jgi:hypothetical protein
LVIAVSEKFSASEGAEWVTPAQGEKEFRSDVLGSRRFFVPASGRALQKLHQTVAMFNGIVL